MTLKPSPRRSPDAARKGSTSAACSATRIRSSGTPNERSRCRAAELAAITPSAWRARRRCSASCQPGSIESICGVHSVKITYARRWRRHHASVRSDAAPYSDTTTQSGSARRSARSSPRGNTTGVRPARRRCHARRCTAGYGCSRGNQSAGHVPARLAGRLVDNADFEVRPLVQRAEQRLAVGHGRGRDDGAAHARRLRGPAGAPTRAHRPNPTLEPVRRRWLCEADHSARRACRAVATP